MKIKQMVKGASLAVGVLAFIFSLSTTFNADLDDANNVSISFIEQSASAGGETGSGKIYKKNCLLKSGCKWHSSNNNCKDGFIC